MNASLFRLLLFDLDGTLLRSDRTIHPATLAILQQFMQKGIKVGFATGRSRASVQAYVETLSPTGPLILYNGAQVWDSTTNRPLFARNLPLEVALAALRLAEDLDLHVNLYHPNNLFIARRSPRSLASEKKDGVPHTVVGDLSRFLKESRQPPIKLLLIGHPSSFPLLQQKLDQTIDHHCQLVHSEEDYLEILPPGVSKGNALDHLPPPLSASQTIAFGDNLNDLELLQRCGLGVAMANAHPTLLQAAQQTIGHHDSDAIATFLRQQTQPQPDQTLLLHLPAPSTSQPAQEA
jgi:Cof subfamily protein (haloacid dehalogenase superfamily)